MFFFRFILSPFALRFNNVAASIVDAFRTRVIANGGTFEANECMIDEINIMLENQELVSTFAMRVTYKSNFLSMGDSLTANGEYELHLNTLLGSKWRYFNKGIGGNTTTQMLARFDSDILANANYGNYCIIMGGVNDIAQNALTAPQITDNLQAMYTAAKIAGLKVIAVNVTPFSGDAGWPSSGAIARGKQDYINNWIANTAVDVDYRIDAYSAVVDPNVPYTLLAEYDDGGHLHMTVAGYDKLGETIYKNVNWLERLYNDTTSHMEGNECMQSQINLMI